MSNALPESTLAWLQQAAADGIAEPMVLCHLLKRVEALEARPIPGSVGLASPAPEAAPVATDYSELEEELFELYQNHDTIIGALLSIHDLGFRRCMDTLGRQHGAAQPAIRPVMQQAGLPWRTDGPAPAAITPADRLALVLCSVKDPKTGTCATGLICRRCRRDSAAVAHELAAILRERHGGSSQVADWLDGVGCHTPQSTCKQSLQVPTRAALAQPEGEGLSLAEVDELCAEFGFHLDDDQGEGLEILREMIGAALARWGRPAASPAPEAGEVEELVACLQDHGTWLIQSGYANESIHTRDLGIRVFRAATLLRQFSAITTEDLKND